MELLWNFPLSTKAKWKPKWKYEKEKSLPVDNLDSFLLVKTRHKPNVNKGGDIYLYELHGAKSKAGVPYSFLTDELIKL